MSDVSPRFRHQHLLFAATIFTSAFLLFQVQPLISKFILPWFGGSPAVWSTCMLFFQVVLFGGYVYAHLTTQYLSPKKQAVLHVGLLVAAACLLPISPADSWKPTGGENPALQIVLLLSVSIGLLYFILSSTGPLLQSWFSRQAPGASPYRLYALSNIGSLLALVSYPFVFEPALSSPLQAGLWSWGFCFFAGVCALCAVGLFRSNTVEVAAALENNSLNDENSDGSAIEEASPTWGDRALWLGLAMTASVMLLATTNQVCLDVATVPFLWILPLTLYLMSFILCFDSANWYSRKWYVALLTFSLMAVVNTMLSGSDVSIVLQILIYLSALFFCCMVCHGELARQKPSPKYLTQFYLLMSAGGAGGGLFVGLLAPYVFPAYWELHIGIVACLLVTLTVFFRDKSSPLHAGNAQPAWIAILVWVGILTWSLQSHARAAIGTALAVTRNFYGVIRVEDDINKETPSLDRRGMFHGSILHGTQFLSDEKRHLPTTYYGETSGAGLAMRLHRAGEDRNIGVVGLGVGTLATYGTKQDTIRFYEINPEVIRMAEEYFWFLEDTDAETEMILGDARLSLEHEPPQNYDILVLDAFSGDAIPTHLLTEESVQLYVRHLNRDGLLCVHISNLHFDLQPVILGLAESQKLHVVSVQANKNDELGTALCHWMLLSRKPIPTKITTAAEELDELGEKRILWTDEWSNLLSVLR
jgi:hypothetical protein